ncbi:MAG: hypothetical protein AABZ55_10320 [Bdellovibrionota bacterium]
MVKNEKGLLAIPMSLILIALWCGLVGATVLMRAWRKEAESQLRLDRCVAQTSLRLKRSLNQLENINRHIRAIRMALVAATLAPEAVPALKSALRAEVAAQELLLLKWRSEQTAWIVKRGCDFRKDIPNPISNLAYRRPLPDLVGEQSLFWGSENETLKVQLNTLHLSSAAEIKRSPIEKNWRSKFIASQF